MDIRDAIGVSFSWSQFVKEMEKRGYTWKLNRKYPALKTPDMERYVRLRSLGKRLWGGRDPGEDPASKDPTGVWKNTGAVSKEETYRTSKAVFFLSVSDGSASAEAETDFLCGPFRYPKTGSPHPADGVFAKEGINTREELAAYRKPLEEQVLSLMKERRTLYRKEPGGMRIQEINGELKNFGRRSV